MVDSSLHKAKRHMIGALLPYASGAAGDSTRTDMLELTQAGPETARLFGSSSAVQKPRLAQFGLTLPIAITRTDAYSADYCANARSSAWVKSPIGNDSNHVSQD